MLVAYCATGKSLQNVLILVKKASEKNEKCYYACPTLLS